jgi:hypothetical protein
MSHWKNPIANLGIIKAGTPMKVVFEGKPELPKIEKVTAYCGCTKTSLDQDKKELVITYSNRSIPAQVQGPQQVVKKIDVLYNTGVTETLTIRAIRTR